ncbi:malonyl-coenzyme A:anthocyanin 3-O-glucoside-6''-O-malonyltransferase-like protein [Tanacetum coccineum]
MSTLPNLTILRESQVSPPPASIAGERSLPLTFSDIYWLLEHPLHYLFFYELPLITKTHFMETIAPSLEHSLSTTLQYFFPFVGKLIVFCTRTKIPEIRSDEGDSVKVTFAEYNLDFSELTGYHPRNCENFYHLIPRLGQCVKLPDYVKIPVFSVQVTFFPNHGFSIGMTSHHSLGDACLKAVLEGKSSRQFITGWVFGVPALKGCSDVRFAENFILILKKRCTK